MTAPYTPLWAEGSSPEAVAAWGEATMPHLKKVVAVLINIGMFDQLKRAAKMLKYCGEDIDGDVVSFFSVPC